MTNVTIDVVVIVILIFINNFFLHFPLACRIRADHSVDNTIPMLREWIQRVAHYYHTVDYAFEERPQVYALEKGPHDWPSARFNHLIDLRDQALQEARNVWADYFYVSNNMNY